MNDNISEQHGISYALLPQHMQDTAHGYIERGIPTGSFFYCVLTNDLFGALGKADDINRAAIFDICSWVYNHAPGDCWGSPDTVSAWKKRGGLIGLDKDEAA